LLRAIVSSADQPGIGGAEPVADRQQTGAGSTPAASLAVMVRRADPCLRRGGRSA
jgi:hypothetical protein